MKNKPKITKHFLFKTKKRKNKRGKVTRVNRYRKIVRLQLSEFDKLLYSTDPDTIAMINCCANDNDISKIDAINKLIEFTKSNN